MVDEINNEEEFPQILPGDQDTPDGEKSERIEDYEDRVLELENQVTARDEALVTASDSITELEKMIADKDGEIALLQQMKNEFEEEVAEITGSLTEALLAYRDMVIQANLEVLEEMIEGDNLQAINQSLNKAKSLTSRVREGVEAQILLTRIPSGAPERKSPDMSTLSPREKIQYAIGGNR